MYNKVDTNMNFVDREKETEKFWRENDIFKKSMENRKEGEFEMQICHCDRAHRSHAVFCRNSYLFFFFGLHILKYHKTAVLFFRIKRKSGPFSLNRHSRFCVISFSDPFILCSFFRISYFHVFHYTLFKKLCISLFRIDKLLTPRL